MKDKVEIFYGIDGYTKPLVKRIEMGESPIKQIINGKTVAQFHKKTDYLVNQIISQRVEKGIAIKNLIRQKDKDLAIELTDKKTLKETRLLPKGFELEGIYTIFGDYCALTSMDDKEPWGLIIKDKNMSKMLESIFDTVWNASKPV